MADDTITPLGSLDPSLLDGSRKTKKERNAQIDGSEFIHLLVTQLKHQDPLDPMENGEFAVQLAQFTQVEQLISINEKLGTGAEGDFSSMASYLGYEVILGGDKIKVEKGDGGAIHFELREDATETEVRLLNPDGSVKELVSLGELSKGRYTVALNDLQTGSGEYRVQVSARNAQGSISNPDVHPAGIVSGIVPGPEPKLLLGDREVRPSEVIRVNAPPVAAS